MKLCLAQCYKRYLIFSGGKKRNNDNEMQSSSGGNKRNNDDENQSSSKIRIGRSYDHIEEADY